MAFTRVVWSRYSCPSFPIPRRPDTSVCQSHENGWSTACQFNEWGKICYTVSVFILIFLFKKLRSFWAWKKETCFGKFVKNTLKKTIFPQKFGLVLIFLKLKSSYGFFTSEHCWIIMILIIHVLIYWNYHENEVILKMGDWLMTCFRYRKFKFAN